MDLHEALSQISQIRQQVAQTEVFRGYRALPVAFSGVLAMGTAAFQVVWLPDGVRRTDSVWGVTVNEVRFQRGLER